MLYKFYYAVAWIFVHIFYRFRVKNRENLPDGRCIVCANHSSLMDAVAVAVAMRNSKGLHMAKFMGKIELSRTPILRTLIRPVMIFVDRGKSDIGAVKAVISHVKSEGKAVIFPEGQRVSDSEDVGAKTGVVLMAIQSDAPVIPVYITPCKKPPIFVRKIDVVFGEPYKLERDRSKPTGEAYREIADDLLERIYALKSQAR